jgi:hypothetical protein
MESNNILNTTRLKTNYYAELIILRTKIIEVNGSSCKEKTGINRKKSAETCNSEKI